MDRREFVAALLSASGSGSVQRAAAVIQPRLTTEAINVVQRFGFVGDGRTDNYQAFLLWTAHVNRVGGGNYLFPPGTYYVARFRGPPVSRLAGAMWLPFENCNGLTITGYGASIVLNGRFHRPPGDAVTRAFMPFDLQLCQNVRIAGFEMDGGVRGMTRDEATTETYMHLISLRGCNGVTLEDLDLHHGQTDGVYIYYADARPGALARKFASRNIRLHNVKSHNNARGGLAALQVLGLLCTECEFSQNGAGLGRYQAHAPGFGVDVEPDHLPPEIDVKTGNLEFRQCRFDGNLGNFLAAYANRYHGYLRLINCQSVNSSGQDYPIIICWPGAVIQGGFHDVGEGTLWGSWQHERGGDLTIRDCEVRTSGYYGVFHYFPDNLVRMERVKVIGIHRIRHGHGVVVGLEGNPGRGRMNQMIDCDIFVPATRYSPEKNYDIEIRLRHTVSEGNLFRTDLPARGGRHFCTLYGEGTSCRNDRYVGTAPGPRDSFRPGLNSTYDTRTPFAM